VELERHGAGPRPLTLALVVTLLWLGGSSHWRLADRSDPRAARGATIILGLVGLLATGGDGERWHAERTLTPLVNLRFLTGC